MLPLYGATRQSIKPLAAWLTPESILDYSAANRFTDSNKITLSPQEMDLVKETFKVATQAIIKSLETLLQNKENSYEQVSAIFQQIDNLGHLIPAIISATEAQSGEDTMISLQSFHDITHPLNTMVSALLNRVDDRRRNIRIKDSLRCILIQLLLKTSPVMLDMYCNSFDDVEQGLSVVDEATELFDSLSDGARSIQSAIKASITSIKIRFLGKGGNHIEAAKFFEAQVQNFQSICNNPSIVLALFNLFEYCMENNQYA